MNVAPVVQAVLFAIFAILTTTLALVIQPTYEGLVVPALAPAALYPSFGSAAGAGFLSGAVRFSDYVIVQVVDPLIAVVALGVAGLYLARAVAPRIRAQLIGLLPRLLVAVVLANVTVPVASVILSIAGATYPVVAGFDGGAWESWPNLAGFLETGFLWQNGALAFIVNFALLTVVLLLAFTIALRDALLGVLLVVLPLFTLLWPLGSLGGLARRGWLLFGEMAFLPCVMVIPLELAVGSSSVLLLLAYLTLALSSPWLVSVAGHSVTGAGFPSGGGVVGGAVQRGLAVLSLAGAGLFRPASLAGSTAGRSGASATAGTAAGAGRGAVRTLGQVPFPASLPVATAELIGHGGVRLLRHLRSAHAEPPWLGRRFPPIRGRMQEDLRG